MAAGQVQTCVPGKQADMRHRPNSFSFTIFRLKGKAALPVFAEFVQHGENRVFILIPGFDLITIFTRFVGNGPRSITGGFGILQGMVS